MSVTYSVYWIRYDNHKDPLSEGYIGVSKNPETRLRYHSNPDRQNNDILYRAINKGATQEILYSYATKKEAYQQEILMRPTERIGWNIIPGGDSIPPVHHNPTWFRFEGKQPVASCINCGKVCSFHKLSTHICRDVCSIDGCDNRVTKLGAQYCGYSCSAVGRYLNAPEWKREQVREQARINGRKYKGKKA